jgi:hypothetical protein
VITVFITDFDTGRQDAVILGPNEFMKLDAAWHRKDELLVGLQHTSAFEGRERWCDLDPPHWRFLIGAAMEKWSALPDDERLDINNPVVDSLGSLLAGLVVCIQQRCDCRMQVMDVTRYPGVDIIYRFMGVTSAAMEPPKRNGMRVVVNNTGA